MRTIADKQFPYEYYITNHLPKGFTFDEHYGCYPRVLASVEDPKAAKELINAELLINHFSEELVEVNAYDEYKDVELVFDLLLFTESKMKECLELVNNVLTEANQLVWN